MNHRCQSSPKLIQKCYKSVLIMMTKYIDEQASVKIRITTANARRFDHNLVCVAVSVAHVNLLMFANVCGLAAFFCSLRPATGIWLQTLRFVAAAVVFPIGKGGIHKCEKTFHRRSPYSQLFVPCCKHASMLLPHVAVGSQPCTALELCSSLAKPPSVEYKRWLYRGRF